MPTDLTGQRFTRLVALQHKVVCVDETWNRNVKRHYWLCKCDCGTELYIYHYSLVRGLTRSCGCYRDDVNRKNKNPSQRGRRENRKVQTTRV